MTDTVDPLQDIENELLDAAKEEKFNASTASFEVFYYINILFFYEDFFLISPTHLLIK